MIRPDAKSSAAVIALDDVSVTFPGQSVPTLAEISLTVRAGEFVSIVGPSGCGKSTLLRVLAGLLPVSRGERVTPPPSADADPGGNGITLDTPGQIAMVFQEARLLPWRTVTANLRLPFELTRTPPDLEKIRLLLELIGLTPGDGAKYPRMLSGGMKMRVALARALVLNPRLVLLDEPFAAVDDLLREQLNEELLSLQDRLGFAAVLVTHHLAEAAFLSQRVVVMAAGPGRIATELPVPWAGQRSPDLRESAAYVDVCRHLRQLLHSQAGIA